MDASMMNGAVLEAGAVSGSKNVKNPIFLARDILLHSNHVYLTGPGAEEFARNRGLIFEDDVYFHSEFRYRQYQHALEHDEVFLDHSDQKKFGTVGAVALDKHGNVCAGTSTGGMTNKKFGRVGDSALIGAGTYANNNTCAVSCTGDGEYFIRAVTAYELSALIEHKGLNLEDAGNLLIHEKMVNIGGEGGLIAIDRQGNYILPFNSAGMYRGIKMNDSEEKVGIYKGWL
jgi:beta-aspartyl-peptidase (threonine type)